MSNAQKPHTTACRSASPEGRLSRTLCVAVEFTRIAKLRKFDHQVIAVSDHMSAVEQPIAPAETSLRVRFRCTINSSELRALPAGPNLVGRLA